MKKFIFTLFILLAGKLLFSQCHADFNTSIVGLQVTFTNTSTPTPERSFWDFGDGTFAYNNSSSFQKTYAKADYYLVKLTIYKDLCFHDTTKIILVGTANDICKAKFSYIVNNNSVSFTSTSSGSPDIFVWEFGDGSYGIGSNTNHNYNDGGFYNVKLRIFKSSLPVCMDEYSEVVKVGTSNDCRADFNYLVNNDSVYFHSKSLGNNITNFLWNFNDGTTSNLKDPKKKYNHSGFYNVCLSVWDNAKVCFNTDCKIVPVNTNSSTCNASFDYYVNARLVTFRDNSTGNPTSWQWDFGDGSTSTDKNTTRLYPANGMYLVHLRASNSSSSSDYVQLINVGLGNTSIKGMFAYLINNNYHYKAATPIDFKGSSLGDPTRIVWNFGNGAVDSSSITPIYVYADTGKYNVCITVTNRNTNQTDTYCKQIHVIADGINEKPNATAVLLTINPNPFSNSANITYFIPKPSDVSLIIYDLIGNKKQIILNKNSLQQGIYTFVLEKNNLENGVYLLELKTNSGSIVKKLTILE